MSKTKLPAALLLLALSVGCRGWTSEQPPVHLNPNMDTQPKHKPYRADDFFADGRSMRTPPEGTVPRTVTGNTALDADYLELDDHYYRGVVGNEVAETPPAGLIVDGALLDLGRERYNIHCAPCHAAHGTGTGLVAERLAIKPPTFHDELRYKRPLGHFYRAILHGVPLPEDRASEDAPLNMPSYATQVTPEERWAIALYVRALQQVSHQGPLPTPEPMYLRGAAADGEPTDDAAATPEEGTPSDTTSSSPTAEDGAEAQQ